MANTTNFGWETPDDTDLVKDGAAAMRTLGSAIDTSMMDLKGGTSGQILSKNSNTDMDFVWIANDQGDITGVTASAPLTGGGTSGAITVGIQDGTTAQKGAVQLTDSTSSTSTTTAATPNSVKSAYDLANGAIPKTLTTTTGDIIYASSANTPARLAIGSSGQILTVSGGIPAWATASSSAKILQVVVASDTTQTTTTSTTNVTTGLSASITPASASNKVLVQVLMHGASIHSGSLSETSSNFVLRYTNTTTDLVDHAIALKSGSSNPPELGCGVVLGIEHSPASTSSCTYEVFMRSNTGGSNTTTIQRSGAVIILMEVAP